MGRRFAVRHVELRAAQAQRVVGAQASTWLATSVSCPPLATVASQGAHWPGRAAPRCVHEAVAAKRLAFKA
jgi:hypothetical protein